MEEMEEAPVSIMIATSVLTSLARPKFQTMDAIADVL
jgi:hypothetical protein